MKRFLGVWERAPNWAGELVREPYWGFEAQMIERAVN